MKIEKKYTPTINYTKLQHEFNLGHITEEDVTKILDNYASIINDPNNNIHNSYFEYYLAKFIVEYVIFGIFIYRKHNNLTTSKTEINCIYESHIVDSSVHQIIQELVANETLYKNFSLAVKDKTYECWVVDVKIENDSYILISLCNNQIDILPSVIKLKDFFLSYYLLRMHSPFNVRFPYLYQNIDRYMVEYISGVLQYKDSVLLAYIKIESARDYVKIGGEYFLNELFKKIKTNIKAQLSGDEELFTFTLRDFLVVSLDCDAEQFKNKYTKVYLEYSGLYFKYQINTYTITKNISTLSEIWKDLYIK